MHTITTIAPDREHWPEGSALPLEYVDSVTRLCEGDVRAVEFISQSARERFRAEWRALTGQWLEV